MTASSEITHAFLAWKHAELACYYAEPCPDAVMDSLVTIQSDAFAALQALKPQSCDDMLLKLFPVLVREFEPKTNEPPLRPSESSNYEYGEAFYARFHQDLAQMSPLIRDAMAEPRPKQGRR
jgi:hypothetical protein